MRFLRQKVLELGLSEEEKQQCWLIQLVGQNHGKIKPEDATNSKNSFTRQFFVFCETYILGSMPKNLWVNSRKTAPWSGRWTPARALSTSLLRTGMSPKEVMG